MIKKIIKKNIQNILCLLNLANEYQWKNLFEEILIRIDYIEVQQIKKEILSIYGGMGSFNDLVLYKDNKLLIEENNQLDKLRKELFFCISR